MKIGLICEFNPFHNGHEYLIKSVRESNPDSTIIVVMSGSFTLKGDLAVMSKHDRARIAVKSGADMVVEIPAHFVLNGADLFAYGSIHILNRLGVEMIYFGSESGDLEMLDKHVYNFIGAKKPELSKDDKKLANYSFAKMMELEYGISLKPNDLLGFCYIKTIKQDMLDIKVKTIKRESNETFTSATKIRKLLLENDSKAVKNHLGYEIKSPIHTAKIFDGIKFSITHSQNNGHDENLLNQAKKEIFNSKTYEEFIESLISKTFSRSHVKRFVLRTFFGIESNKKAIPSELLVLAFNERSSKLVGSDAILKTTTGDGEFAIEKKINELLRLYFPDQIKVENTYVAIVKD